MLNALLLNSVCDCCFKLHIHKYLYFTILSMFKKNMHRVDRQERLRWEKFSNIEAVHLEATLVVVPPLREVMLSFRT